MNSKEHCLRILGLRLGATEQQIKDAYRDLVKVWHPDRFGADSRLYQKAEEKLREVNAAYDRLRDGNLPDVDPPGAVPGQAPPDLNGSDASTTPRQEQGSRGTAMRTVAMVAGATAVIFSLLFWFGSRGGSSTPPDRMPAPDLRLEEARSPAPEPGGPATAARRVAPDLPSSGERGGPDAPAPAAPATTGMLDLFSQPTGATVYFNEEKLGQTPLRLTTIAPGEHRVRLELDGHLAWSSPVRVVAGGGEKVVAILEKQAGN